MLEICYSHAPPRALKIAQKKNALATVQGKDKDKGREEINENIYMIIFGYSHFGMRREKIGRIDNRVEMAEMEKGKLTSNKWKRCMICMKWLAADTRDLFLSFLPLHLVSIFTVLAPFNSLISLVKSYEALTEFRFCPSRSRNRRSLLTFDSSCSFSALSRCWLSWVALSISSVLRDGLGRPSDDGGGDDVEGAELVALSDSEDGSVAVPVPVKLFRDWASFCSLSHLLCLSFSRASAVDCNSV